MNKLKYGLEAGRTITKNGTAIMTLGHVIIPATGAMALSPVDADILAHRIVNALNHMEALRQKKVGAK
jgi:ribosomal protein S15P/S13E